MIEDETKLLELRKSSNSPIFKTVGSMPNFVMDGKSPQELKVIESTKTLYSLLQSKSLASKINTPGKGIIKYTDKKPLTPNSESKNKSI